MIDTDVLLFSFGIIIMCICNLGFMFGECIMIYSYGWAIGFVMTLTSMIFSIDRSIKE